jgi:hypothetical protein
MSGVLALRRRLPLIVFLLLFLVLLMLVGIACACLTDNPMQAVERAVLTLASVLAVIEIWTPFVLIAGFGSLIGIAVSRACGRASPAVLQRFLF